MDASSSSAEASSSFVNVAAEASRASASTDEFGVSESDFHFVDGVVAEEIARCRREQGRAQGPPPEAAPSAAGGAAGGSGTSLCALA